MRINIKILFIAISLSYCISNLSAQREHYIDGSVFLSELNQTLDPLVKGYQISVGDETGVLFSGNSGLAKAPNDGNVAWNNNLKMMSASIAKMIATVAIMNMLESATIPGASTLEQKLNLKLKDYIPIRWRSLINGTEGDVTLRHLLNHRSGFPNASSIHPEVVLAATMNTPVPDAFEYANTNFNLASFMAIYMTNPSAMANIEDDLSIFFDSFYNSAFTNEIRGMYQNYVNFNVLFPSGIVTSCAKHLDDDETDVYRYTSKVDGNGLGLGTVSTCMSNGWMLSAQDMVKFMKSWDNPSQSGNILTQQSVDLINEFGLASRSTPLGWVWDRDTYNGQIEGFGHNGIWITSNHLYTSGIVLTQDNVYMAINVNSNATDNNVTQRGRDMVKAYNEAVCPTGIITNEGLMKKYNSADEYIVTSGVTTTNTSQTNVFKAGETIILQPGFQAQSGSHFRAYISGCNDFPSLD